MSTSTSAKPFIGPQPPRAPAPPPGALHHPLRILSLDGGGVRGYTTLLILQRVFREYKREAKIPLDTLLRPCDFFDLIGGTWTGGLIAIMLGKLEMTVEECLEVFDDFVKEALGSKASGLVEGIKKVFGGPGDKTEKLKAVVEKVLKARGKDVDGLMYDGNDSTACRVMVTVTAKATNTLDIFRSYPTPAHQTDHATCRIWEAACAICAHPYSSFRPVEFASTGEKWYDGGLQDINPIAEVVSEARRLFGKKNINLGYLLSVGCGVEALSSVPTSHAERIERAKKPSDADVTWEKFLETPAGYLWWCEKRVFRLSVDRGMDQVNMDKLAAGGTLRNLSNDYLRNLITTTKIDEFVKMMSDRGGSEYGLIKPYTPKASLNLMPPAKANCDDFLVRPQYQKRLNDYFSLEEKLTDRDRKRFVLHALGGMGKTQITLYFFLSAVDILQVYWIRATDFTTFSRDFLRLGRLLDEKCKRADTEDTSQLSELERLQRVQSQLEKSCAEWLLVLDDAGSQEDLDNEVGPMMSISRLLPSTGRILATTRHSNLNGPGKFALRAAGCRVEKMDETECRTLMRAFLGPNQVDNDSIWFDEQVVELFEGLGGLPLALVQAAQYIVGERSNLREYAKLFKDSSDSMKLLLQPVKDEMKRDMDNGNQCVWETFRIAWDNLDRDSRECLSALAFYDRDRVSLSAILRNPMFQQRKQQPIRKAFNFLMDRSLILDVPSPSDDAIPAYQVHPIIHRLIFLQIDETQRVLMLKAAIERTVGIFDCPHWGQGCHDRYQRVDVGSCRCERRFRGDYHATDVLDDVVDRALLIHTNHLVGLVELLERMGDREWGRLPPSDVVFDLYDLANLQAESLQDEIKHANGALRLAARLDPPSEDFISPQFLLAKSTHMAQSGHGGMGPLNSTVPYSIAFDQWVSRIKPPEPPLVFEQWLTDAESPQPPPVIWKDTTESRSRDAVLRSRHLRSFPHAARDGLFGRPMRRPDPDEVTKYTERYRLFFLSGRNPRPWRELHDIMDKLRGTADIGPNVLFRTERRVKTLFQYIHLEYAAKTTQRLKFLEAVNSISGNSESIHSKGRSIPSELKSLMLHQAYSWGTEHTIALLVLAFKTTSGILDEARYCVERLFDEQMLRSDFDDVFGCATRYKDRVAPRCGCQATWAEDELLNIFHFMVQKTAIWTTSNDEYNPSHYIAPVFHIARRLNSSGCCKEAVAFLEFCLDKGTPSIPLDCRDSRIIDASQHWQDTILIASARLKERLYSVYRGYHDNGDEPAYPVSPLCSEWSNSEKIRVMPGPSGYSFVRAFFSQNRSSISGDVTVGVLMEDLEQLKLNCKKWVKPKPARDCSG